MYSVQRWQRLGRGKDVSTVGQGRAGRQTWGVVGAEKRKGRGWGPGVKYAKKETLRARMMLRRFSFVLRSEFMHVMPWLTTVVGDPLTFLEILLGDFLCHLQG